MMHFCAAAKKFGDNSAHPNRMRTIGNVRLPEALGLKAGGSINRSAVDMGERLFGILVGKQAEKKLTGSDSLQALVTVQGTYRDVKRARNI